MVPAWIVPASSGGAQAEHRWEKEASCIARESQEVFGSVVRVLSAMLASSVRGLSVELPPSVLRHLNPSRPPETSVGILLGLRMTKIAIEELCNRARMRSKERARQVPPLPVACSAGSGQHPGPTPTVGFSFAWRSCTERTAPRAGCWPGWAMCGWCSREVQAVRVRE